MSAPNLQIICGDALIELRNLPDESVQCCVTSPPYWGLRDYGTATWEGGTNDCKHEPPQEWIDHNFNANSAFGTGAATQSAAAKGRWFNSDGSCRCGAKRIDAQLGLEKTPEQYVARMVEIFREVRRVLRKDGTLWLNLGDSYYNYRPGGDGLNRSGLQKNTQSLPESTLRRGTKQEGLKEKDLCGIPWRVAFALQADGWWLRQDIIWNKPNPMPESVTDRCTKSHEYIFLLTKSARYYFDADSIQERSIHAGKIVTNDNGKNGQMGDFGQTREGFLRPEGVLVADNRNKRSVWTVTTQPYPEAHFATYPPDLIKPCIMAGSRVGDTILDPFAGSGTTGEVALELSRSAILIELNPKYIELIKQRCDVTPGLALA